MTQMDQHESLYTILLSAEQCAEHENAGDDWIRDATNKEIAAVQERYPGIVFGDLFVDKTGRPYYWMTVDGSRCPASVREKASDNIRVFRWK